MRLNAADGPAHSSPVLLVAILGPGASPLGPFICTIGRFNANDELGPIPVRPVRFMRNSKPRRPLVWASFCAAQNNRRCLSDCRRRRARSLDVPFARWIQPVDATPHHSAQARWNGMHMEGLARTWFAPSWRQRAESAERAANKGLTSPERFEERERRLISWPSMEKSLPHHGRSVPAGGVASGPLKARGAHHYVR